MNIRPNVATSQTYLNNLSPRELRLSQEKARAQEAARQAAEELKTRAHLAAKWLSDKNNYA